MSLNVPVTLPRLEQMFAAQAARTPDLPAIFFRGKVVRYGELSAWVDSLSRDLSRHGVAPGVLVAISLQRTAAAVAVLLAILKARGAYLPLDARNPAKRVAFMLADSGCSLLITDAGSAAHPDFGGNVVELCDGKLIQRTYLAAPRPTGPVDLAYLIYTSGSTGKPKGVMLGHGATFLVDWARRAYSPDDLSRVAATTSLSFDPSILEIFVPLCSGGAIVLKENALEPFGADERPTLLNTVPSVVAELCRANALPPSLRVLITGGEALSGELAREVFRSRPALALHNHYGPTEATTCATVARVPPDLKGEPSIGCPVAGATVLLLDKAVQPVPDGETGEIYVGGRGLALGYLNRHQLTAERFIVAQDRRLYRTGDLGCWRDGELHFGGRVDQQVKIRGFRIELGEVESALMRLGEVESALAVVNEASGRRQLVAYVQSRQPLTPAAVRQSLAAWLPDYMLPARLVVLSAFPLLASGKVDRNALPQPTEEPVGPDVNSSRMEKPIIHVFEEVLSRASVGPQDSFFDLGGDSLASVQAALRLGEILGYELPPALIHQAPSPRALARALEHGRVHASGHLSLLEPGGVAPPLFCMADLFGHAFNYLNLARRLGEYRPVHGVSPGSLQEAFTRSGDIATLTRGFTADLRAVRPSGPYLIAGYSAGGALAVDLACALEREGEEVRLILLDSCLHSTRPSAALITRWALRHAAGIFERGKLLTQIQRLGSLLGTLRRGLGRDAPPAWIPRSQLAFAAAMIKAGGRYRPGTFAGPTLMVKATEREPIDELADEDGLMGWSGALTGPVVRVTVAGGHHQFLRDPLVAETALAVNRFLLAYD